MGDAIIAEELFPCEVLSGDFVHTRIRTACGQHHHIYPFRAAIAVLTAGEMV